MNIFDYFNSSDVAEYCRSIGHTLNAVESAVIIGQCDSQTLAEKHAAYRTVIAEYPDMEIPQGNNHEYIKSFHNALGDTIAYEEKIVDMLLLPEPDAIYRAKVEDYFRGSYFSSYERALDYAMDYVKREEAAQESHRNDNDDTLIVHIENDLAYTLTEEEAAKMILNKDNLEQYEISAISIYKGYIDSEKYLVAEVSQSGGIMSVQQEGVIIDAGDVELHLLDSCYIDIPVPFKEGDLVEVGGRGHLFGRSSSPYGGVYVLKSICRDDSERNAKSLMRSDLMDMTAEVYYEENGSVECEVIHFYPDLRYCKRELECEKRILKYVSLYMQEKLCLCSLLKIQNYLLLDEKRSELRSSFNLKYDLGQLNDNLLDEK